MPVAPAPNDKKLSKFWEFFVFESRPRSGMLSLPLPQGNFIAAGTSLIAITATVLRLLIWLCASSGRRSPASRGHSSAAPFRHSVLRIGKFSPARGSLKRLLPTCAGFPTWSPPGFESPVRFLPLPATLMRHWQNRIKPLPVWQQSLPTVPPPRHLWNCDNDRECGMLLFPRHFRSNFARFFGASMYAPVAESFHKLPVGSGDG